MGGGTPTRVVERPSSRAKGGRWEGKVRGEEEEKREGEERKREWGVGKGAAMRHEKKN